MRCFNHHDREAVGSCKACAKGLCEECAADLGHGLSCKGPHEEIVESYANILKYNSRAVSHAPKNAYLAPTFFTLMGLIFIWFGHDDFETNPFNFLTTMGGAFIVYAAIVFVRARAMLSSRRA